MTSIDCFLSLFGDEDVEICPMAERGQQMPYAI